MLILGSQALSMKFKRVTQSLMLMPLTIPWLILGLSLLLLIRALDLNKSLFFVLAGHIVIYSLLGLLLMFGWMAFPVMALAVFMYFFELFVAVLQAYIFTLLAAIFINMMVNPSH
jgi:F0F1-type ATP synthase membrane subunit a